MKKYLTSILLLLAVPVYGQVVLDGTMGTAGLIKGPAYDIKAEYGQKAGANLFHSFSQFGVGTGEIASFGASADIQNIISRVTGGSSSQIDGTLRSVISGTSDISDANLYLLNPAGVIFGPSASLDIGGSFHVSTADYLKMGEEERFYAAQDSEVLSAAVPSAFGFLDDTIEKIRFEGNEIEEFSAGLSVSEGKTISVIGGDIEMSGISYQDSADKTSANLYAPGGQIHLASLASPGEAILTESGPDISSFRELGKISLSDHSLIKTSGEGSGNIFIRCGEFFAADSSVEADSFGDQDGGITDIQVNTLALNRSTIFSDTEGIARGGSINIRAAESVTLSDNSRIFADATGEGLETGSAGTVSVEAKDISLSWESAVSGETYGKSQGGNVLLRADESVIISGGSQIFSRSTGDEANENAGAAGKISIESKTVSLSDESMISTDTYSDGNGGSISVSGADNEFAESLSLSNSRIYGGATGTGNGGTVHIRANDVSFAKGEIGSQTLSKGDAGDIQIEAEQLELKDASLISSASTFPDQGGDAGTVHITVSKSMNLSGGSAITTEAEDAGKGQISVIAGDWFFLTNSRIATSIKGGDEDAGDIYTSQNAVVLRKSQIVANAYEGKGGNIHIIADPFVRSTLSLVDASSQFGIDGSVYIESPDDVSSSLMTLPGTFLDTARWLKTPCFERSGDVASSFLLLGKDAAPCALNDWLPSPLLWKFGNE